MSRPHPRPLLIALAATALGGPALHAQTAASNPSDSGITAVGRDPLTPLDANDRVDLVDRVPATEDAAALRAPGAPAPSDAPAPTRGVGELVDLVQALQQKIVQLEARVELLESQRERHVRNPVDRADAAARDGGGDEAEGVDPRFADRSEEELERMLERAEDQETADAIRQRRDQLRLLRERRQYRQELGIRGEFDRDRRDGSGYRGSGNDGDDLGSLERLELRTDALVDEVQAQEQAEDRERAERERLERERAAREALREQR